MTSQMRFLLDPWLLLGFFGQFLFFLRFAVQWLAPEKRGRSTIPVSFWYLSIGGACILFLYSLKRQDPVFCISSLASLGIYVRNISLVRKDRARQENES